MVGGLSSYAISAVVSTNRFFSLLSAGMGSVVGTCGIYIGQFYGAGKKDKINESFLFSLLGSLFVVVPFLFSAIIFPEFIISFFIDEEKVIVNAVPYIRLMAISYVPLFISSCVSNAIRSVGKPFVTMKVSGLCIAIKLILNYLLIYEMTNLGIKGAAISTIVVRMIEVFLYLYFLREFDELRIKFISFLCIPVSLAKNIIHKAIPFFANDLLWSLGNTMMLKCFGEFGSLYYSAYGIGSTFLDIFYMIFGGFGMAILVYTSMSLGRGDRQKTLEEVRQLRYISLGSNIIMCSLMLSCYFAIPVIYSGSNVDVLSQSQIMLVFMVGILFFYNLQMTNYYILRAGGDTRSVIIMDSGIVWCFSIPVLLIFTYLIHTNTYILLIICVLAEVVKLLVSIVLIEKKQWLNNLTS